MNDGNNVGTINPTDKTSSPILIGIIENLITQIGQLDCATSSINSKLNLLLGNIEVPNTEIVPVTPVCAMHELEINISKLNYVNNNLDMIIQRLNTLI